MPDISMCNDSACPLACKCYRFLAIPSDFRQSWFGGAWDDNRECNYYWPASEGKRVRPFDDALAALHEASEGDNHGENCAQ